MEKILDNNSKHYDTINYMIKCLKIIESNNNSIQDKIIENEIELKKYKLMIDENISALKKITNNLL